jgi:hypothetical protein
VLSACVRLSILAASAALALLQDEYADSRVLDDYRKRRVEQLKQMALKNKFGRVGHESAPVRQWR